MTSTIDKCVDEHEGIAALHPAVLLMQKVPEYFNIFLGLEAGNETYLDQQITGSIKTLEKELKRYNPEEGEVPNLSKDWENLKKIGKDDETLYEQYQNFLTEVRNLIGWIGKRSTLILVSDMETYYFIDPMLNTIPELSMRLFKIGNLARKGVYQAEANVARWNTELADAQAQGRRLTVKSFEGDPRALTVMMFPSADWQVVWNERPLFASDETQITVSLEAAIGGNEGFEELNEKLDQYKRNAGILTDQYTRIFGFNITNPTTGVECLKGISDVNTAAAELWTAVLNRLDETVKRNTFRARALLNLNLIAALVSILFAFGFIGLVTLDMNRSVRTLKTLFRGLNENDLTLTLKVRSQDEFGELMIAFNGFLKTLQATFGSFKQSAHLVSTSVFDLSSSSKEITTTANQQSAGVSEIVSTMESSKNLSEQIAVKTTEVAALAGQTQELSSKGAELREANQTMMEDIRKQNQKIITEIRNLSDMIIRISEAIGIIDGIADQTKLIAFNASLEASSSGESGARFSVVAAEIRRFADNVVESTKEIKQKIEEVQNASQTLIAEAHSGTKQIEIGYERMSEQKTVFEHIVENSQSVAIRSQQISNLSRQQEVASSQIFNALKEISAGVKQFVVATSSTSKIADNLNEMSEELKEKVEKYRTEA
jgi:methyl-accepting chemotaxis protein